ncbi:hypothetical protein ACFL0C_00630, partial [Patescibacteria group bacterium]
PLLSFAATWAAILGVLGLHSVQGMIFPPLVLLYSLNALSFDTIFVTFFVGSLVTVSSLAFYYVMQKTYKPIAPRALF